MSGVQEDLLRPWQRRGRSASGSRASATSTRSRGPWRRVAQSKVMKLNAQLRRREELPRGPWRGSCRKRSAPPRAARRSARRRWRGIRWRAARTAGAKGARVFFVVTSSRGLCGGYNARVIQVIAGAHGGACAGGQETPLLAVMGRKGLSYFRYHDQPVEIALARHR